MEGWSSSNLLTKIELKNAIRTSNSLISNLRKIILTNKNYMKLAKCNYTLMEINIESPTTIIVMFDYLVFDNKCNDFVKTLATEIQQYNLTIVSTNLGKDVQTKNTVTLSCIGKERLFPSDQHKDHIQLFYIYNYTWMLEELCKRIKFDKYKFQCLNIDEPGPIDLVYLSNGLNVPFFSNYSFAKIIKDVPKYGNNPVATHVVYVTSIKTSKIIAMMGMCCINNKEESNITITELYVHSDHRLKGIGKCLINICFLYYKTLKLKGGVNLMAIVESIDFFVKMGFFNTNIKVDTGFGIITTPMAINLDNIIVDRRHQ